MTKSNDTSDYVGLHFFMYITEIFKWKAVCLVPRCMDPDIWMDAKEFKDRGMQRVRNKNLKRKS